MSSRGRGGHGGRGKSHGGRGGRGGGGASGRGSRKSGSGRSRECIDFKILGECARNDTGECPYSHMNQERFISFLYAGIIIRMIFQYL